MSEKVSIPSEYTFHVNPVMLDGGVGVELALLGDPAEPLTVDLGLGDVSVHIDPVEVDLGLDDIGLKVEPLSVHIDPLEVDLGLDNIGLKVEPLEVDLGLDDVNVCLSVGFTEIPRIQVHVPTRYDFGFCLFGLRVFNFTLAGETMLVTQDNPPRLLRKPVKPVGRPQGGKKPHPGAQAASEPIGVKVLAEDRKE